MNNKSLLLLSSFSLFSLTLGATVTHSSSIEEATDSLKIKSTATSSKQVVRAGNSENANLKSSAHLVQRSRIQKTKKDSPKAYRNDSLTTWRDLLQTSLAQSHLNRGLVNSPIGTISGLIAGVNVGNGGAERLAMLTSVRVRGNTSIVGGNNPLVLIDGISSDLVTLSTIYPSDIEKFEVLKNAAETAQFGSRGAAGVIVVTTKKGREGKFQISYDGNYGWESVYRNLEMLSAQEYIAEAQRLGVPYINGGYNENYTDLPLREGSINNHHVAFSGGTSESNYRASLAYTGRGTVIRHIGYDNFVAKLDFTQLAFDNYLVIDFGVFGSSQDNRNIADPQALFYGAATQNPTLPSAWNGSGWTTNPTANQIAPPQARLRIKDEVFNQNLNSHLSLKLRFLRELTLKVLGTYSFTSIENAQFFPTWTFAQGMAMRKEEKHKDWLLNAALDYAKTFGIHQLDLRLLSEYQANSIRSFGTTVRGFNNNDIGYDNLALGALRPYGGTSSYNETARLASFLFSLKYRLYNKYTLSVSSRWDGSSLVGKDNTWGVFPSVSADWNLKAEPFLRNYLPISQFNLRIGYGRSGNLNGISAYSALQRLEPQGIVAYHNTPTVALGVGRNANPELTWEKRNTFNVGGSIGWWNNRLLLTAEYYYAHIFDMLYHYDVPIPPFATDKLLANNGSMLNEGVEFGLGVTPIQSKDWELNLNVNLTWSRNKLLSLDGDYRGFRLRAPNITSVGGLNGAGFHGGNNNVLYQIVGQPLGVFYLPHSTGLRTDAKGKRHYAIADLNHDGNVDLSDGGDRYIAGQATPKIILGSNLSLRYRNFDVSAQINGAFGHKIYNGTALSYMNMSSFPDYNVLRGAPAAKIEDQIASDYWLESGDYVNIDYVTIGWNIPVKSRFVQGVRASVSVNNLATITAYSGLTPMINSHVLNATMGIDDKRSIPVYRTYSVGLNIQF